MTAVVSANTDGAASALQCRLCSFVSGLVTKNGSELTPSSLTSQHFMTFSQFYIISDRSVEVAPSRISSIHSTAEDTRARPCPRSGCRAGVWRGGCAPRRCRCCTRGPRCSSRGSRSSRWRAPAPPRPPPPSRCPRPWHSSRWWHFIPHENPFNIKKAVVAAAVPDVVDLELVAVLVQAVGRRQNVEGRDDGRAAVVVGPVCYLPVNTAHWVTHGSPVVRAAQSDAGLPGQTAVSHCAPAHNPRHVSCLLGHRVVLLISSLMRTLLLISLPPAHH